MFTPSWPFSCPLSHFSSPVGLSLTTTVNVSAKKVHFLYSGCLVLYGFVSVHFICGQAISSAQVPIFNMNIGMALLLKKRSSDLFIYLFLFNIFIL